MPTFDEIREQYDLLQTHRRTLAHHLKQQAIQGSGFAPPTTTHGIYDARTAIARIKKTLREWNVAVDDHPDDEAPSSAAGSPVPAHTGDIVSGNKISGDINVSGVSGGNVVIGHGANVQGQVSVSGGNVQGPVTGVNLGNVNYTFGGPTSFHPAGAQPSGSSGSNDPLTRYENGLRVLLERLGKSHPRYGEALVYDQRLRENIYEARTYGDTRERQAARAEVISRLNELTHVAAGVSFQELSGEGV